MLRLTLGREAGLVRSSICMGLAIALVLLATACADTPTPSSMPTAALAASSAPTSATVRQLLDGSNPFADQRVTLTGTIILECPEGCWFFLDDGTGKVYVDLKPAGITIPQKVGSRVELCGKVKGSGGNLQILGDEVKFIDER